MRELDRWAAEHAALDLGHLQGAEYHSAEYWFERWPPLPSDDVRRRIVQHLIEIHDRWHCQLQHFKEPYYLGIWLLGGQFLTGSQVVASIGYRAEEYRGRHLGSAAEKSPPPALYHGFPHDLSRFEWTRHVWTERDRLSSFGQKDWLPLLRRAKTIERIDDDAVVTFEHEDWLGMLRT